MEIIISNASNKPIYEQITTQIKSMIMNGELQAGEMLPSIRALAKSLHISVITTQRAYEDLQRDGFIETVLGRGTFVSSRNTEFVKEEKLRMIEEHLQEAVDIAHEAGVDVEKMVEIIRIIYDEE
jgi:GntR family transcriptional regulator